MLKAEARWLATRLCTVDASPILNVGSSSLSFRSDVQPWIEQSVFSPLRRRGLTVIHQDLFPDDGVDVAADLYAPATQARLRAYNAQCIICSNVLEHVRDHRTFSDILLRILVPGGRLLVTVPRAFPYHPDPIDTMFRPSP